MIEIVDFSVNRWKSTRGKVLMNAHPLAREVHKRYIVF